MEKLPRMGIAGVIVVALAPAIAAAVPAAAEASRNPMRSERRGITRAGNAVARRECHRRSVSQRIRVSTVNGRWAVTRFRCGVQEYTALLLHGGHGWSEFELGAGPEVCARVPYPILTTSAIQNVHP